MKPKSLIKNLLIGLACIGTIACATISALSKNTFATSEAAVGNDGIDDNNAAWHIEAKSWWKSAPRSDVISSYFQFNDGNNIYKKTTVGKNQATVSFNSILCPSSFYIYVKNNKFTDKTINWSVTISFRGTKVLEKSGDHYYLGIGSDDYSNTLNIKNSISVTNVKISSNGISNYSNDSLCKEFDIYNGQFPYINGHSYCYASSGGNATVTYTLTPVSSQDNMIFDGYIGSKTSNRYYNEQLIPSNQAYSSSDSGTLVANFYQKQIKYKLSLYMDSSMTTTYSDDSYKEYDVEFGITLPVIENTNFIIYDGWFEVIAGTISNTATKSIPAGTTGDKTYVLKGHPAEYSVTLNTNGAISCGSLTSYKAGSNTALPIPTKNGYTFGGWYLTSNFTGPVVTAITSTDYGNKVFYANWQGIVYSVNLVTNGASACAPLTSYTSGVGAILPTPTKRGYSFKGWYTSSDFSGSQVTSISGNDYGNKTYYAKWEINVASDGAYRIICYGYYSTHGADWMGCNDSNVKVNLFNDSNSCFYSSATVTISRNISGKSNAGIICDIMLSSLPYRIQFHWEKCYLNTTHSVAEVYYKGQKLNDISFDQNMYGVGASSSFNIPEDCSSEKEKNHQYLKNSSNNVSFVFNNLFNNQSFSTTSSSTGPNISGEEYLTPSGNVEKFNYVKPELTDDYGTDLPLDGYYDIDGKTKFYDEDLKPTDAKNYTNNMVLYPAFKQKVNLDTNGGSMSKTMTTYLSGVNNALPEPTKPGYTFVGWVKKEPTSKSIHTSRASSEPMTVISSSEYNPLELVAVYSIDDYTINYDLDGGYYQQGISNPISYNIESDEFTLINPSKEHYDFIGWTGTDLSQMSTNVVIAHGSSGNRSYTAHYALHKYNIIYQNVDGVNIDALPKTFTYESNSFEISNSISLEGYKFDGWIIDGHKYSNEDQVIIPKGTDHDIIAAATWIKLWGVSFINSITNELLPISLIVEANTKLNQQEIINKISDWQDDVYYYSLDDFYVDQDCKIKFDFSESIIKDTNIYVNYNQITLIEHAVDIFVENYLHPEIDFYDNRDTNNCRGTDGYYQLAKEAFDKMSDEEKEEFLTNSKYILYVERFYTWARNNGETFDTTTFTFRSLKTPYLLNIDEIFYNYDLLIVVITFSATFLLICGYCVIRKKNNI